MGKMQKIEDMYINLGYRKEKLKKALENDKQYQKLLAKKKHLLKEKATSAEKKKYVLSTNNDYKILSACKALAKKKISKEDRRFVLLIKTQLEADWRKPLEKELGRLKKKYNLKTL